MKIAAFAVVVLAITRVRSDKSVGVRIRNKYVLAGGRAAYVMDDAIPQELVISLTKFMTTNDNWRYVLHDPQSVSKERLYDDRNGMPWKSWKDPSLLKATTIGERVKTLVRSIDAKSKNLTASKNFDINEVYAALIRRGDRTKIVAEGKNDEDSYTVVMFSNIVWRKNGYGELLLYDDDGEIMATIRPKFGRIVVFHSSIKYVNRPPSIAQLTTQSVVILHLGADVESNKRTELHYTKLVQEIRRPPSLSSSLAEYQNKQIDEKDLAKHLTMYRKNKNNQFVAVFDDLFDEKALSAIRAWTIKYGLYFFCGSLDVSSDNVQWIAAINVHDFAKTDFWPIIHKISKFVSNTTSWYPYDVACNLIRSYDHTRFHLDTSDRYEKELTFLLYLSPEWNAADYGETAFMETNNDHPRNEYNAEVVPTFGRAVIFNGNFPHSAHPPAVQYYNARYTLVVKLSYTKMLAVKKTFVEEKKHERIAMPRAVSSMAQLKSAPAYNVAMAKVRAVVEHIALRNLLHQSSGAESDRPEQDEDEPKERENMNDDRENNKDGEDTGKEDEGDDMEKDNEEEPQIPFPEEFEDMDTSLTSQQKNMVASMIKYHKLDNMSEEGSAEDVNEDDPVLKWFAEERRQSVIKKWKKDTLDANKLNDYLELFLRQRILLKNYAMGKMATFL